MDTSGLDLERIWQRCTGAAQAFRQCFGICVQSLVQLNSSQA